MKARTIFFDILVGIPGGCLIFIGMLMFNTLLSLVIHTTSATMLILLCITSLLVGMLARLLRPIHGMGTALAAGVLAALLILYLWRASTVGTTMSLVFGPAGMAVCLILCPLGTWIVPEIRKLLSSFIRVEKLPVKDK